LALVMGAIEKKSYGNNSEFSKSKGLELSFK